MMELFDPHPKVEVQEAEYKRLLGFPGQYELEGRTRELADWARDWYAGHGRPWIYIRLAESVELGSDAVEINGRPLASKRLLEQLRQARAGQAALVAVSAGKRCEEEAARLWQAQKPDEYFFLEVFGSVVVEHLVAAAAGQICGWADQNRQAVLPHYSPGYPGWDVSDQARLWEVLNANQRHAFAEPIQVLASGMLDPKKSLLAVFGITPDLDRARQWAGLSPCDNCSLSPCQFRRTPYRHAPARIEAVELLQPPRLDDVPDGPGDVVLDPTATYSVHRRTLEKWTRERLRLRVEADGSVSAGFRYDGTTCTNLGRPLQYEYHVRLGSFAEGYPILEANCAPAPTDTGHMSMCEYLRDKEGLMRAVQMEKPLLGRPLHDVLSWNRPSHPAGCYCDSDGRQHKWGLVLEVIHYALAQRQKPTPIVETQAHP